MAEIPGSTRVFEGPFLSGVRGCRLDRTALDGACRFRILEGKLLNFARCDHRKRSSAHAEGRTRDGGERPGTGIDGEGGNVVRIEIRHVGKFGLGVQRGP